jgi:hypothetical protein
MSNVVTQRRKQHRTALQLRKEGSIALFLSGMRQHQQKKTPPNLQDLIDKCKQSLSDVKGMIEGMIRVVLVVVANSSNKICQLQRKEQKSAHKQAVLFFFTKRNLFSVESTLIRLKL